MQCEQLSEGLTIREFARTNKLSERTVRRNVALGKIPSYKVGGARRIRVDDAAAIQRTDGVDAEIKRIVDLAPEADAGAARHDRGAVRDRLGRWCRLMGPPKEVGPVTGPGRLTTTPSEVDTPESNARPDKATIGAHAIEYAAHNWPVFPLHGKIPAIAGGRGVLDATTDLSVVAAWWSGRYRGANIGGRIPESMVMIDIDPYHGGLDTLAELERRHGRLPETLTDLSGSW